MSKATGLGARFFVDGVNLSGDIGSLQRMNNSLATTEQQGIDKEAFERLHALRTGGCEFSAWMNKATGAAHPTLKTRPTTDRIASYFHRAALGTPAFGLVCKQLNYDPNRTSEGALSWSVTAESNGYGLEWGKSLTAGARTDTTATNGTAIDTTASLSFGAQAYLHVQSFSGTDVTVKIQDSADNNTFADVTAMAFTQITGGAPLAQRLETGRTATIRRYVRAVTVTSAGFTSLSFAVVLIKNSHTVVF